MHLYIHIPFCFAKCDYCDFFSVPCGEAPVPNLYISAVINEATCKARAHHVQRWDTVYIGGGTPSLLSSEQIRTLLAGVMSCVPDKTSDEITMEMNPESLTEEKLRVAQESGVTRLSLGIQSLAQHTLSAVHRHCSPEKALAALETVRNVWKGNLNTDAIAGLPDGFANSGDKAEAEKVFRSTLDQVLSFHPDHFSLYTLTVEEGTPLYKRNEKSNECDADEADRLWLLGRDLLKVAGFRQYEVSNFAKIGFESKHNFAYWRQEDYIGCGAGGCGTIYSFNGGLGQRSTNTTDIAAYSAFWNEATVCNEDDGEKTAAERNVAEVEQLPLETEEFEFLMMGLRTLEGVNEAVYRNRFSSVLPWNGDLTARFKSCGEKYDEFIQKKYLEVYKNRQDENVFRLTEQGILFLNTLLYAFA